MILAVNQIVKYHTLYPPGPPPDLPKASKPTLLVWIIAYYNIHKIMLKEVISIILAKHVPTQTL